VLPLVFALFLVAIFWPLQRRLQTMMPSGLAVVLTLIVLLLVIGLLIGALWWSGSSIAQKWPQYAQEFEQYSELMKRYGFAVSGVGSNENASEPTQAFGIELSMLTEVAKFILVTSGAFALVFGYLVLGLLEIDDYPRKLERIVPPGKDRQWLRVASKIIDDFQRYMVVRTLIGLINGGLVGTAAWFLGLNFAFIWGLLSFLLNYIPTIGSLLALTVTLLFALMQFDDWNQLLLVLLVLSGIRIILGNFVDPLLQGEYLAPSPLVVMFSVAFWGWLWGVAGAFIGVPLTILVIMICQQFQHTSWIATLLSGVNRTAEENQS